MDGTLHTQQTSHAISAAQPLRIGLDGFNLAMARGTGVATYARVLSQCVAGLGHHVDVIYGINMSRRASQMVREVVFFDNLGEERGRKPPPFPSLRWAKEILSAQFTQDAQEIPVTGKVIGDGFRDRLPAFDRIMNIPDLFNLATRHFRRHKRFLKISVPNPPQIMHWTYPIPARLVGARNVYTLHDLVPLRLPHTTLDNKPFYARLIRGCIRYGDHLCTVSDASLRDVLNLFPEAAGKVTNTYESFDPPESALRATEADIAAQLRGVFDLPHRGYFLFFGSLEPKKNIGRLVEAYLSSGVTTPLVLVGAQAWKSEQELRLVKARAGRTARPGEPQIIQIEYLPFAMLMTLIRGAKAVTFPSLYEGFGLPVLEAMALGTPTLTSTGGSLPEIAGDAALVVDPYDTAAIAAGLRRLDSDDALLASLRAAGVAQAAHFNMQAYRARMEAFYRMVLTQPR